MRENRPYGSEGGASAKAVVPTPIHMPSLRDSENGGKPPTPRGFIQPDN